jgi:hypothetical protein
MALNLNPGVRTITTEQARIVPDAYINLHIVNDDGTRGRSVGAKGIALYSSKAFDKALIKRLTEGGEEALAAMKGKLGITFYIAGQEVSESAVGF